MTKANSTSLWRSMRMVAWSFIGIRRGSESQQDIARVKPLHVIVVGITGALLFVVGLVILVNWVVAK
jgi:hypothetical protein